MARSNDSRWLVRSSAIALSFGCLAIGAMDRGSAQSFQGTANVVAGQVDSLTTGTGTTDILINGATPQAVIDWTPTDTSAGGSPIAFQNAGTTATFSRSGGGDFAVLNRILPTGAAVGRSVLLDGNIQGLVGSSVPSPGGTVYFYTPNGLVIGSNAQIDVGQLGLTTSSPQVTTGFSGGFIDVNGGNTITFTGANSASSVVVQPGAQINALVDTSSYVAIFAPYIEQGGSIDVNGSAALIAAEAGTMRWSGGLFDVQVSTGTDGDAGNMAIFHTGSTGGPASGGSVDTHRIFTVAVPKNTAITTLIASGSSLGFDVAGAADVVGNAIVLTGGSDLLSGSPVPSSGGGAGTSSVQVTNTAVTSSLSLYATGTGAVEAVGGGTSSLASDLFIRSPIAARVEASSASSVLNIAGNVFLDASRGAGSGNITGGNAFLTASGSASLTIGGFASLDASASTAAGGTATGGLARTLVDSGASLTIGGDLSLASLASTSETETGNAQGGTAELRIIASGSTATINGGIDIDTAGLGGGAFADLPSGVAGGEGRGGISRILVDVGPNSLDVTGTVNVEANGRGGDGNLAASGNGFGGLATIFAGASSAVTFQSDLIMEAAGTSGSVAYGTNTIVANATSGGNARGGVVSLSAQGTGAIITILADLTLDASARSDGTALAGAAGGLGQGGTASIGADSGSIGISGFTTVTGVGIGGSGTSTNSGVGGTAAANAINGGALTFHGIDLLADGVGGSELADPVTGDGFGGTASLFAESTSNITLAGSLLLSATGVGGLGDSSPGLLNPGSGNGGVAELLATGSSTVNISNLATIVAYGIGAGAETLSSGDVAAGGVGDGGLARLSQQGAATITVGQDLVVLAYGEGGDGSASLGGTADGGAGIGGTAEVVVGGLGSTGSLVINGSLDIDTAAVGGSASVNGSGGNATAGFSRVQTIGGTASIQAGGADTGFAIAADASAGVGAGSGTGGEARGGTSEISAVGGDITVDSVIAVFAGGFGGDSTDGNAGAGYGGVAQIAADSGAVVGLTSNLVSIPVTVDSSGAGGTASGAGNGGNGSAGQSSVATFTGGEIDIIGDALISAVSDGGDGYSGGIGNGNLNPVLNNIAFAGLVATSGAISVSGVTDAIAAGSGGNALGLGGTGGGASGGFVSVFSNASGTASSVTLGELNASALALGGAGGSGDLGSNGGAGGSAVAGVVSVLGTANNGDLVTGDLNVSVAAIGGLGGNGGDDSGGPGGDGGAGGNAIGGAAILGLIDGTSAAIGGTATFGTVSVLASAQGGTGGNGGISLISGGDGDGGAGGSATAATAGTAPAGLFNEGPTQIVATGGSVTMDQFTLNAAALGGEGGSGLVSGLGGFASSGGFDISVKSSGLSGQRGNLFANDVLASLLVTPGVGGVSYRGSGPRVMLDGGDAVFADLIVQQEGDQPALAPVPMLGELSVVDGTLSADVLAIFTSGTMSVLLDNSAIFTQTTDLVVGNFATNAAGVVPLNPGAINSAVGVTVSSGNDIIIDASIASGTDIILNAPGSVRTYDLSSGFGVTVGAVGSITTRDIFSGTDVGMFATNGSVNFGSIFAAEDVDVLAAQGVAGDFVDAGDSVVIESGDTIIINGSISAGLINPVIPSGANYSIGLRAVNDIFVGGDIGAANDVGIGSLAGSVAAGAVSAGNNVLVLARTGATFGAIDSVGGPGTYVYLADSSMLSLSPTNPFDPAPIFAAAPVAMAGPITVGDISGGRVVMAASGNVSLGDVFADEFVFARGNNLFGVSIGAVESIRLESAGVMSLLGAFTETGDIDLLSGGAVVASQIGAGGSVAVQAAQDIALFTEETDGGPVPGEISAGGTVRLVAQNGSIYDLDSASQPGAGVSPQASISAGSEILLLAGDGVALNTLASTSGAVYIANSSMAALGGTFDNFQIGNLLESSPAPVGGSILLNAVSGPAFIAAGQGPFTIGSVNANNFVFMHSQTGLLSINGAVRGRDIILASADIDIGTGGSIQAFSEGLVQLGSLNSTGAVIGDGATGGGYRLSAAELARISGDSVDILALDVASLPIDMVIGNLSVTGPLAGSTVEATSGALNFITGVPETNTASGAIRITGQLAARGFTPTNQLGFFTGTLQLDANTGLIEILGQATQISGEIVLGVERFHAAEATILDRLLENPVYAGRVADINTPLATPRPDGIIRSADIDTDALSQFLIQNTGTRAIPAGIVVFSEGPIERDILPSPGSIEFVVNGQTVTDNGTLTGTAVFDFLISDENRPFFTPESTINGCLISAAVCDLSEPEPDVTEMDAEFLPSDSITHFTEEPAQQEQAVDPEEREEAEEEAKRAPIPPPTPIISTQPLAPVIDVDEPVAGAGNPGFISSAPLPAGQGRETAQ